MFEDDTRQNLLKVLADLERDLKKINDELSELEALRRQRDRIASLIRHIQAELGIGAPTCDITSREGELVLGGETEVRFISPKPIAEGMAEIFDEYHRSMDVKEIVDEFRQRGWKLSENNPQEVLRSTLTRHPKLFRKVSRAKWQKI